ncbi:hypothetical protein SLA2020_012640 [Shorea laevis]
MLNLNAGKSCLAVEAILDKENFTLEELRDEDEIIQECKALNARLISLYDFLTLHLCLHVEQLVRYVVEEPPEDAEKRRTFKFPFIACEIFTCEVDIILKTLVEDEELMNLLFSFLDSKHSHSTLLAGYFSKVVICLLLRKMVPFMQYVKSHQEIMKQLVDVIGIMSIMEVLIRLIGADEHMFSSHKDSMQWMEDMDVLDMVVDKFSSSDSPEVHANVAEMLCAITRFTLPGLAAKISSPSFVGRLFHHALEDSRPKSVLVNSLSVCISLLDPKRITLGVYHMYNRQLTQGSTITANPETVEGMLESLGELLKLLEISSAEATLPTTYGKLQPPLGKHRLKIVEFISVLLTVGSEAAEKELIQLGALQKILDLFFLYPYNNFLHHHVESIVVSCLESKNVFLVEHLLRECNLVGKILEAEKNFKLTSDLSKEITRIRDVAEKVLKSRPSADSIFCPFIFPLCLFHDPHHTKSDCLFPLFLARVSFSSKSPNSQVTRCSDSVMFAPFQPIFKRFSLILTVFGAGCAMKGARSKADSKETDSKLKSNSAAAGKKTKKAAKDPNKPKRPASAFFVFMRLVINNLFLGTLFYMMKTESNREDLRKQYTKTGWESQGFTLKPDACNVFNCTQSCMLGLEFDRLLAAICNPAQDDHYSIGFIQIHWSYKIASLFNRVSHFSY